MDKLIDKLSLGIDEKQKQRIIEKLPSGDISILDAEEVARLLQQDNVEPISRVIYQKGQTNSRDYNEQFKNYYLDLYTIFTRSGNIDTAIFSEKTMNNSAMTETNQKLEKIKNEVDAFSFIVNNNQGFTRTYRDNFNSKKNFLDLNYITESNYIDPRTNALFNNENQICTVNSRNRALTLHEVNTLRPYISKIKKINQTGSNLIEAANKNYPIENLFKSQVWSEVILTNSPFDVYFSEPLYYEERMGALCKIQIIFDTVQPINVINLASFSEFPFKILGIVAYKDLVTLEYVNSNTGNGSLDISKIEDVIEILSPNNKDARNPFYIKGPVSIPFKKLDNIKAIEIAIQQPHYTISRYSLNQEEINEINLMEELFTEKELLTDIRNKEYIDSVTELDYHNRSILWKPFDMIFQKFLKLIGSYDNNIIDKTINILDKLLPTFDKGKFKKITQDKENIDESILEDIKVKKYTYQYGFQDIDVNYTQYSDSSMYVSKLYKVDSNVKEVAVNASEEIPEIEGMPAGSIEYYVTNVDNPTVDEWFPILPEERSRQIKGEVVPAKSYADKVKLDLLFEAAKNSIQVFDTEPGIKILNYLDKNGDEITSDNTPVKSIVIDRIYSSNSSFIVNYEIHPSINPYIVDFDKVARPRYFINENGKKGEKFLSTDKFNRVVLSYYPYIDYKKVNSCSVDPDYIYNNYNNPDEHIKRLIYNNPNIFHYNPNYKGDNGYRPITISMAGTIEVFDKGKGAVIKEEDVLIENDSFGIPYRYSYIQETGNTYKVVEINRNENSTVHYPYFYNVTDYAKRLNPTLKSYDPYDYPVFEYLQLGKEIYFGESFDENNSSNFGEITVDYMYLVEGIKIKIIIRKNPYIHADISPCVYDYTIKSRDFQF